MQIQATVPRPSHHGELLNALARLDIMSTGSGQAHVSIAGIRKAPFSNKQSITSRIRPTCLDRPDIFECHKTLFRLAVQLDFYFHAPDSGDSLYDGLNDLDLFVPLVSVPVHLLTWLHGTTALITTDRFRTDCGTAGNGLTNCPSPWAFKAVTANACAPDGRF